MKRLTTILLAALALVLGLAVGGTMSAASSSNPHRPDATWYQRDIQRGCTIRFDQRDSTGATVPRIYTNAAHYCVGVDSVSVNGDGWLVIHGSHTEPLMDIQVQEDETLASRGIHCGPSGGGIRTVIECYDSQQRPIKARYTHMYGPGSNLFIKWTHYAGPGER